MPSLGKQQVQAQLAAHSAPADPIKHMLAMSDGELQALLGMDKRLQAMKDSLMEADKLEGKAREIFEKRLEERLTPRIDGYDFDWMIKDAKREADPKKSSGSEGPCC